MGIRLGLVPYWAGALFLVAVMIVYELLGGWGGCVDGLYTGTHNGDGPVAALLIIAFMYLLREAVAFW